MSDEGTPITLRIHSFRAQSAQDAAEMYGDDDYASYLERHAVELSHRFPAESDYFMSRTLAEALRGNDGN